MYYIYIALYCIVFSRIYTYIFLGGGGGGKKLLYTDKD